MRKIKTIIIFQIKIAMTLFVAFSTIDWVFLSGSITSATADGSDSTTTVQTASTQNFGIATNNQADASSTTTGTLAVIVHVYDGGAKIKASDFRFIVNGNNSSSPIFQGSESQQAIVLSPGNYSVRHAGAPAIIYRQEYSPDCSSNISNGETKSCIINVFVADECQSDMD